MLFKPEMIVQILAGKKTMTRRLVKEGEYCTNIKEIGIVAVYKKIGIKQRTKWFVGKRYAVCPGRGKPQAWYCPDCKHIFSKGMILEIACKCNPLPPKNNDIVKWKPLFIELIAIKKEKLLDITEEDAKREGFDSKYQFLDTFFKINKASMTKEQQRDYWVNCTIGKYNPDVWVLTFKVIA